jgi:DNA-binding Xre family transcriptional regulator
MDGPVFRLIASYQLPKDKAERVAFQTKKKICDNKNCSVSAEK